MPLPSFRRVLAFSFVGLLLTVVAGVWLLGTEWGRRQVAHQLRNRLARQSDLVLGPLNVDFSLLRDFPHVTASVQHVSLTDTSFKQSVNVLRVGRADIRLELRHIWRGDFRVRHLTLRDVQFRQLTDSLGRDWGLRGKGPRRRQPSAPPDFILDSLVLLNVRVTDRNDLHHSGFSAHVRQGRLRLRVLDGQARVRGQLHGQLEYLRSGRGNLFEREPVVARIRYRYNFRQREGTFTRTRVNLNNDTVRVNGTHRGAGPGEPRGTHLNLAFEGDQPLLEVLHVAFPPGLARFLRGASSPSHAHIRYIIRGLSGPTARPRTVLRFDLQNAQVQWADAARRIKRWDAHGTFDNGPGHTPRTTSLRFEQCRLYSEAGQLDAELTVRDFTNPHFLGHVRGRTELQTLASVVVPELWDARGGQAALDLHLNGRLPNIPTRTKRRTLQADTLLPPIAARGTVRLEQASFDVPRRQARVRGLNVLVRLQDSIWQLDKLTGRINGMRVRADARTTHLLAYFSGQHPTTSVSGNFRVDELQLNELRRLLAAPDGKTDRAAPPRRPGVTRNQALAARALNIIPAGLRLNARLYCERLVIGDDTLGRLAATVRHDGHQVQLRELRAHLWGGKLSGLVSWPTDTLNLQPITAQLAAHFPSLNYQQVLTRVLRPNKRSAKSGATDPTLRDVLMAANGEAQVTIDHLQLTGTDRLTNLRLHMQKQGREFQVPDFTFRTGRGGVGRIAAQARFGRQGLARAHAELDLRYAVLDVQRLLQLMAALSTVPEPTAQSAPRHPRRAAAPSPFLDGTITGQVRVQADQMRYGVLRGQQLRLLSRLTAGQARIEECTLQAFGGQVKLTGLLLTDSGAYHHPLRARVQVRQVRLPEVFALARELGFDVLGPDNIRGTMQAQADVRADLDNTFLPRLATTRAFLRTDLRDLELLQVDVLMQALWMLSKKRTGHLYFEPVQPRFVLEGGKVLIPNLDLSSNLTDMQLTGEYGLNGEANLYLGLSPMQALLGNNRKRIARIQSGEASERASRGLLFVNLRRTPGTPYKVRLFKKQEQEQLQQQLQTRYQRLLRRQTADSTFQLVQ